MDAGYVAASSRSCSLASSIVPSSQGRRRRAVVACSCVSVASAVITSRQGRVADAVVTSCRRRARVLAWPTCCCFLSCRHRACDCPCRRGCLLARSTRCRCRCCSCSCTRSCTSTARRSGVEAPACSRGR
jgi:hypothetical protein